MDPTTAATRYPWASCAATRARRRRGEEPVGLRTALSTAGNCHQFVVLGIDTHLTDADAVWDLLDLHRARQAVRLKVIEVSSTQRGTDREQRTPSSGTT